MHSKTQAEKIQHECVYTRGDQGTRSGVFLLQSPSYFEGQSLPLNLELTCVGVPSVPSHTTAHRLARLADQQALGMDSPISTPGTQASTASTFPPLTYLFHP